ncbi:MAG: C-type lectin domain-containing protein [Oscillospiraceae bacterium]|nr:C-type lectin domain-containing protein [Oscillospiraceae bacterium]
MKKLIALILVLAALLSLCACGSLRSKLADMQKETAAPEPEEAAEPVVLITAAPETSEPEPEPSPEPSPEIVSEYRLFAENVSWTEAKARCEEEGGHLVVINDSDEFNKVVDLASEMGVTVVWIGLHRELDMLVWETDDINAEFYYNWDVGEPSEMDGERVEDYVFIWNWTGRGWVYNDCINDPAGDYPEVYRNNIGFVCEIEKPKE